MTSSGRDFVAGCVGKLVIASALLVLDARPGLAQDSPCADVPADEYRITVVKDVPAPRLNHELRRSDLGDVTFHDPRAGALGLMTSQLEIEYGAAFRYIPAGGAFCFWADGVTVTLRFHAFDVYVAAEYPAGGCPYNAILAHELQHVDIAHKHLDYYTPNIEGALTSLTIPKAKTPVLVTSVEQAHVETLEEIQRLLKPAIDTMQRAMLTAQQAIDSPNSYERVRRQCSNW